MATYSTIKSFANASIGRDIEVLNDIHQDHINISIYERGFQPMSDEILQFLTQQDIQLKLTGDVEGLIQGFSDSLAEEDLPHDFFLSDFSALLKSFEEITQAKVFRVFFATIKTDMCRRFHTDVNKLRLLCTYAGPGTLWLPEEAIDRYAHNSGKTNEEIVTDPQLIQQANTGDVVILKGALYPNAKAAMHRSPSIEEANEKRLMLRIDIHEPLNFM